ncbi:hypothetical protein CDL15_Pgr026961 [Punica granatum]|uniref:Uncharacterized protein n=1 Tax=Punica granatum TaxID=22663 RepID=A0A218XZ15_PUNGR|nr:hypothetical protein CDL15_Pgr026961 [Punica granatum]
MELHGLLMDGAKGSKILVTTRAQNVAKATDAQYCFQLNGLPEAESLSLLMQITSKKEHEWKNQALEAIGKEIVNKCAKVPLAIMTVGQLLSASRNREEDWLYFKNIDLSRINQAVSDIIPTLRLSYDSLPSNLKQCFAYCSLFPKGHVLNPLELIRLWGSQGFISSDRTKPPEESGHECFMELVSRSFFQDVEEDIYGNIVGCKMHMLMHDLAITVARDNCIRLDHTTYQTIPERARHVSGYLEDLQLKADDGDNRLRTWLVLKDNLGQIDHLYHMEKCIIGLQKLRALCLRGAADLCVLPKSIGKLKHLRHLDLSYNRKLEVLPLSISKLCNLETLNLEGCTGLRELPSGITKLVNLRQLDISGCANLTHIPKGLGRLTCLHTLGQFVVGSKGDPRAATLDELKCLSKLKRNLVIRNMENLQDLDADFPVEGLNLQSLELHWVAEPKDGDRSASDKAMTRQEVILERFRPHQDLKGLGIEGYRGGMFSAWVSKLQKLVKLEIISCHYCKRLPDLGQLPHLKRLCLAGLSQLEGLEISEGSEQHQMSQRFFPSIEELELMDLPKFNGWERRKMQGASHIDKEENPQMVPIFLSKVQVQIRGCPRYSHVQIQGQQLSLVGMTENILNQLVRMVMASRHASMISANSILFSNLKSITIDFMIDVEHLQWPKELFRSLPALQSLVIKRCHPLQTLCGRVILRHLIALETLSISYCPELDLSIEDDGNEDDCGEDGCDVQLQGHSKLKALHIDELPKMKHFPEWHRHLRHLEHLSISDCDSLKALPHWMGNLTTLTTLKIWSCDGLRSLPRKLILQFLTTLESLSIEWCRELDLSGELDNQQEEDGNTSNSQFSEPTKLRELAIIGSQNMVSLPLWIQHLTNLKSLDISFCESLEALPDWFPQLISLKRLDVSQCGRLSQRCRRDIGEDWPKIDHVERVFA